MSANKPKPEIVELPIKQVAISHKDTDCLGLPIIKIIDQQDKVFLLSGSCLANGPYLNFKINKQAAGSANRKLRIFHQEHQLICDLSFKKKLMDQYQEIVGQKQ